MQLDSAQLNAFATVIDEGSFERAAAVWRLTLTALLAHRFAAPSAE